MFSFNFDLPHDELELEDEEHQQLVNSTQDLTISATPGTAAPASSQVVPSLIPSAKVELQDLIDTLPPIISYSPVRIPLSPSNPSTSTSTSTSVSSNPSTETILLKRDLFDARFQILSDHSQKDRDDGDAKVELRKEDRSDQLDSIDQDSDLVKGVYEGGLKVWECSLDLVRVLSDRREGGKRGEWMGKKVLEMGCGTAFPACYAFAQILQEIRGERDAERRNEQAQEAQIAEGRTLAKRERKRTRLDLQDYNRQGADLVQRVYSFTLSYHSFNLSTHLFVDAVLSLITLPNLLLVYAHHLTLTGAGEGTDAQGVLLPTRKLKKKKKKKSDKEEDEVKEEDSASSEDEDEEDSDDDEEDSDDDEEDGEDDEAKMDFDPTADWRLHPGEIELSPGFLDSFTTLLEDYDIELRFYEGAWEGFRSTSNIQSTSDQESRANEVEYDLVLASETIYQPASLPSHIDVLQRSKGEQLIACKRIYFGVGGGEVEFVNQVEGRGGKVETVWPGQGTGEQRMGVGRTVLRVGW